MPYNLSLFLDTLLDNLFEYILLIPRRWILYTLLTMVVVFGPSSKAWMVIMGHLFLLAHILQLAHGFPLDFNQTTSSMDLEKRASPTGTAATTTPTGAGAPGKYTNIRLASSCAGRADFFETVFDNMAKIVSL
jgi:hypothetical protein